MKSLLGLTPSQYPDCKCSYCTVLFAHQRDAAEYNLEQADTLPPSETPRHAPAVTFSIEALRRELAKRGLG